MLPIFFKGPVRLSREQYASWCLLITEARDKNYVQHTSDSLISISAKYYSKKKNPERLTLAYYYMGRVNHDLNNVPKAREYYLKALEAGGSAENYGIEGRI